MASTAKELNVRQVRAFSVPFSHDWLLIINFSTRIRFGGQPNINFIAACCLKVNKKEIRIKYEIEQLSQGSRSHLDRKGLLYFLRKIKLGMSANVIAGTFFGKQHRKSKILELFAWKWFSVLAILNTSASGVCLNVLARGQLWVFLRSALTLHKVGLQGWNYARMTFKATFVTRLNIF